MATLEGAFPALLRRHRLIRQLTQEALAERAGVSTRSIGEMERGRSPRPRTVELLAAALELAGEGREEFVAAGRAMFWASRNSRPDRSGSRPGVPTRHRPAGTPPRQLPADLPDFAGRGEELAQLFRALDDAGQVPPLVAVTGPPGVGKTALIVHWAHRVRDRFPDGQLYVNLRGFDPGGQLLTPADAIRRFLDALGVPPGRVPSDLEAQSGLYRSVLADRRVLILLDNARDSDQVRPLLPGTAGGLVMVSSRAPLTSLVAVNGARPLHLTVLSGNAARRLLERRLGAERVNVSPQATSVVIGRCAGLPLALTIAASRAALPGQSLATMAAELTDTDRCLDALTAGDPSGEIRAVFSWSYAVLSPPAARLFRLLGLYPGAGISTQVAASLGGLAPARAGGLLAELTRASVITEQAPGRYAIHDLLRAYAADLTSTHDPARARRAATSRLLDYYVHSAHLAERRTNPHRDPIAPQPAPPSRMVPVERFASNQAAVDWLRAEHANLLASIGLAATAGFDVRCWQLAWTLDTFLERRGEWRQLASTWQTALAAARHIDDPGAQAYALRRLGYVDIRLGRYAAGGTTLRHALDLYTRAVDAIGQGNTRHVLAAQSRLQGDYPQALDHARQALALFQSAGHRRGQGVALNSVGWYLALLGNHDEALALCEQARTLLRQIGDRYGEAHAWDNLGVTHHLAGAYGHAAGCLKQAANLFRSVGEWYYAAASLTRLGDAYLAERNPGAARFAWRQALDILSDLDHADADPLRAKLDDLRPTRRGAASPGRRRRPAEATT